MKSSVHPRKHWSALKTGHSLSAVSESLPEELEVVALDCMEGEVMAVSHRDYPIYGLQFHPESILTPDGRKILENFLNIGTIQAM